MAEHLGCIDARYYSSNPSSKLDPIHSMLAKFRRLEAAEIPAAVNPLLI
jgi:hypothetical protein